MPSTMTRNFRIAKLLVVTQFQAMQTTLSPPKRKTSTSEIKLHALMPEDTNVYEFGRILRFSTNISYANSYIFIPMTI